MGAVSGPRANISNDAPVAQHPEELGKGKVGSGRLGFKTTVTVQLASKMKELLKKEIDIYENANESALSRMSEKSEKVFEQFKQGEITKETAHAKLENIRKESVSILKSGIVKQMQIDRSIWRYQTVGKIFSFVMGGGSKRLSGIGKYVKQSFVSDKSIKNEVNTDHRLKVINNEHIKNLTKLDNIEKNKINEAIKGIEDIERHLDDAFGPVATPREVAHNLDDAVDTVVLLREVAHKISETANRNLAKNDPVAPAPLKQNREISQKKNDETYKELNNLVARFMPKPNNAKASEADTKPSMGDAIERNKIAAALSHDPLHNA